MAIGKLDDDRLTLMGLLAETWSSLATRGNAHLAEHGLVPAEFEVCMRLARSPEGRLRMSDLAAQTRLTSSGITRLVDRLVERGLVARRDCASDRRTTFAVITDEGRALLERVLPAHLELIETWLVSPLRSEVLWPTSRRPCAPSGTTPRPAPPPARTAPVRPGRPPTPAPPRPPPLGDHASSGGQVLAQPGDVGGLAVDAARGLAHHRCAGGGTHGTRSARRPSAGPEVLVPVAARVELVPGVVGVHQVDPAGDRLDPVHDARPAPPRPRARGRCPGRTRPSPALGLQAPRRPPTAARAASNRRAMALSPPAVFSMSTGSGGAQRSKVLRQFSNPLAGSSPFSTCPPCTITIPRRRARPPRRRASRAACGSGSGSGCSPWRR